MMRSFEYVSPKTQAQAFSLLGDSWGQSEVLAGGTDLLALMKDDVVRPHRLAISMASSARKTARGALAR
jgi:xanthine dehydrogenase YagS FAD-binding subunit